MIRRTQEWLSANKLMDEVMFSALDWPGKTVRLERDTLQDYCQRPSSAGVSVAEVYHENSKLFPQMREQLTATRVDVDEVRSEFLRRRSVALADIGEAKLDPAERALFTAFLRAVPPKLFYAIELRVAVGGMLAAHEPISDRLLLVKQLSDRDIYTMRTALRLVAASGEPAHSGGVLFVIGNFARNDVLFGARGYRRTLMEAGRVIEGILRTAAHDAGDTRVRLEFDDRTLDLVLEADGVEEGILAAVELEKSDRVR